jgi:hypothetical protein
MSLSHNKVSRSYVVFYFVYDALCCFRRGTAGAAPLFRPGAASLFGLCPCSLGGSSCGPALVLSVRGGGGRHSFNVVGGGVWRGLGGFLFGLVDRIEFDIAPLGNVIFIFKFLKCLLVARIQWGQVSAGIDDHDRRKFRRRAK